MSKDELHEYASSTTPEHVSVPQTWGGLLVWAIGKWGAGAIFLALLVPVYFDLRAANATLLEITTSNVRVLEGLTQKIERSDSTLQKVNENLTRLDARTR